MHCAPKFLRCTALALLFAWPAVAPAAVVGPGDGTQNTTAPPGIPGWANVGQLNDGSGVYLGNGWVLTPRHVGAGGITFDSLPGTFFPDGNQVLIHNADNSLTDLMLFHLSSTPALPALSIAPSSPTPGTIYTNMGFGLNRAATVSYYNADFSSSSNSITATYGGYQLLGTQTKRWGTNAVLNQGLGQSTTTISIDTFGNVTAFASDFYTNKTDFQLGGGTSSEDYLAAGDSGGAVFNSANQLIGLNEAIGTYTNQPGNLALFGDQSYMTDLATYRDQIVPVVPEPATAALLAAAIPLLLQRRKSRASF